MKCPRCGIRKLEKVSPEGDIEYVVGTRPSLETELAGQHTLTYPGRQVLGYECPKGHVFFDLLSRDPAALFLRPVRVEAEDLPEAEGTA